MGKFEKPGVDIRRLRYFLAVCDHGGFSRASMAIGVAQPALTRQIQVLEQELGVQLVTRNGRNALPSEAGLALLSGARGHIDGLDQLIDRFRQDYGREPRRVSLGICPSITPLFLECITENLRQSAPKIDLTVIEAYSGDLRNLMNSGGLDLAISYRPAEETTHRVIDLLTERLVLVSSSPLVNETPVTLAQAFQERLILPSIIHQLRRIIETVAQARGLVLTTKLELDSLGAVKAMLDTSGGGLSTILPYHSVREDAAKGRFHLRQIDDPDMVRTIALLHPQDGAGNMPVAWRDQILTRAAEIRATLEAVS